MENPQAFPSMIIRGYNEQGNPVFETDEEGMTLRDYFAEQALPNIECLYSSEEVSDDEMAFYCYKLADAMLKERGKS